MAKENPKAEAKAECDWKHDVAYKLVDLYVKELTERRDKKMLNLEGLVEAYFYVLGRLNTGEHEMNNIVKAVREEVKSAPETPKETGMDEAVGKKKLSAGLLKALENM